MRNSSYEVTFPLRKHSTYINFVDQSLFHVECPKYWKHFVDDEVDVTKRTEICCGKGKKI